MGSRGQPLHTAKPQIKYIQEWQCCIKTSTTSVGPENVGRTVLNLLIKILCQYYFMSQSLARNLYCTVQQQQQLEI